MCDTGYSVKALVADLRDLRAGRDEAALLREAPELAKRLVLMKHNWLRPYMCVPDPALGDKPTMFRLHEEPDHGLAVFVVALPPGQETPPHDHGTWAVIAGLEGHETSHTWERVEGTTNVRRIASQDIDPRTILSLPDGTIHSLHNDSGAVSVTLHLYGMDVDYTDHRNYSP